MAVLYKRVFSTLLLIAAVALPTAYAQDESPETTEAEASQAKPKSRMQRRADERRARILEKYEATGRVETCVPMRSLRQSIILDNRTIFFESTGRRGFMNNLPQECNGLLRERRFAYANSFGSICNAEIITILDSFGRTWGSCGLGQFEEYKVKPKPDEGGK